jgi:hypothetical protein
MPVAQSPAHYINSSKGFPSITESFPLVYLLVLCASGAALPVVLLRIPDFRDRDFRIFKPILKKGFESDPDLSDPILIRSKSPRCISAKVSSVAYLFAFIGLRACSGKTSDSYLNKI